jgi:sec-independent protein translocase protein TatB
MAILRSDPTAGLARGRGTRQRFAQTRVLPRSTVDREGDGVGAMPGFQELLVIAVVAALVLGPNRLPKAAADLARLLARFRTEAHGAIAELKKQADVEGLGTELRVLRNEVKDTHGVAQRAVRAELRALTDQPGKPATAAKPPVQPIDDATNSGITDGAGGSTRTQDTA